MHVRSANLIYIAVMLTAILALPVQAKSSDRNQPMNAEANSSDCSVNDGPCILNGNVLITQGTMEINADKADLRRANGDIRTVKLTGGPVRMKQQMDDGTWMNATSSQIDYDMAQETVVFTGSADIQQAGRGSIKGERIVYNMKTGQVQSGGNGNKGERVKVQFQPQNKAAKPETP